MKSIIIKLNDPNINREKWGSAMIRTMSHDELINYAIRLNKMVVMLQQENTRLKQKCRVK